MVLFYSELNGMENVRVFAMKAKYVFFAIDKYCQSYTAFRFKNDVFLEAVHFFCKTFDGICITVSNVPPIDSFHPAR